jgi:alpha-galactosidase
VVNEKFPRGVRFLAEEIKKQDLKPGIWLAPFLVRKKSSFFTLYPEAVLKDAKGNPVPAIWNPLWGLDYTYTLDVTHPKAIEFLENLFKTFTRDYGYNYLKLDFLFSASLPGLPYNKRLTPSERYRQALELIRKVVGKNTFLLGCGAPLIPSIGIFDGMRIGCDVTPFWYPEIKRRLLKDKHALSTEKGLINTINRSFMHRNWWLNDPDCLIVRKEKNKMNPAQTILMATVMAMSGGILLVSDNLVTIEQDRIEILEKTLRLSKMCQRKKTIPLGMFGNSFPRGFINEAGFFAVWNPTEKEEWIELDIPFKIKLNDMNDYWTGEKIFSLEVDSILKKIKVMLKPFQAIVIGVKN